MDRSEAKEGNSSEKRVNPCPRSHQEKKKKTEDQHLEKAFEISTTFSN
jgi:hypothetical protein